MQINIQGNVLRHASSDVPGHVPKAKEPRAKSKIDTKGDHESLRDDPTHTQENSQSTNAVTKAQQDAPLNLDQEIKAMTHEILKGE